MILYKGQCTGEAQLNAAHIKSYMSFSEAVFSNPGGIAVLADGMTVGASTVLRKMQCIGEMSLVEAQISGYLDFTEAKFDNTDDVVLTADGLIVDAGIALNAEGLVLAGNLWLHRAQCTGEVRLRRL